MMKVRTTLAPEAFNERLEWFSRPIEAGQVPEIFARFEK